MISYLFLDLDDTILDFQKAERIALSRTLETFGQEPEQGVLSLYSRINRAHWQRLERGELTREQVLTGRFQVLFQQLGIEADPCKVAETYESNLSVGHYFLPGAEETLEVLSGKYHLYLASNGTAKVQAGRLRSANIGHFFERIFISQEMGTCKPSRDFFDRCFASIPSFDRSRAMMVGDSLTSDILGGKNAGILTCWINPREMTPDPEIQPDYQIRSITELPEILDKINESFL